MRPKLGRIFAILGGAFYPNHTRKRPVYGY